MHLFQAIILGAIEGLTEFLPISSSGHLTIASKLMGLAQSDFVKSFEIVIQLGSILAVVWLYWRKLLMNSEILKRVIVAFIPTGIIGLLFYKVVKNYLIGSSGVTLAALFIGGIALIIFELWYRPKTDATPNLEEISYQKSFWIGVCQAVAIIPGVSRMAATIVGGLWMNIRRETIVEFSFLLAVPTMLAATGLDLLKNFGEFSGAQFGVLSGGFIASFVVALITIKFLLRFIKTHTFIGFGIYRVIAAIVFWLII